MNIIRNSRISPWRKEIWGRSWCKCLGQTFWRESKYLRVGFGYYFEIVVFPSHPRRFIRLVRCSLIPGLIWTHQTSFWTVLNRQKTENINLRFRLHVLRTSDSRLQKLHNYNTEYKSKQAGENSDAYQTRGPILYSCIWNKM